MKILRGIPQPLAGEHVLLSLPPLGPYATAAAGEPALRRRAAYFPQRSLTHVVLGDEQRSRIGETLRLAQAVAPGVVDGFEVAVEGTDLLLLPGHAVAADGQDVELAYPLRLRWDEAVVASPRVEAALENAPVPFDGLPTLREVLEALDGTSFLPHAMVLVAMPRSIALDRSDESGSPCPNATEETASLRAAWEDGFQLAWVPWPEDRTLPPWTLDGQTPDPRFRNRLAYAVFNAERERLSIGATRSMRRWLETGSLTDEQMDELADQADADAIRAAPWPWDGLGVPLAMVGFDADFAPLFADRAAVVRQGGGRRNRSALVPGSGDDVLWQSRVAQLLEHLSELTAEQRVAAVLERQFDWLPPAGVLPRDVVNFISGRQTLFPPTFDVQAQPVPLDMVDALIAESSALAPFNLSLRDQVQILVPVPARYWDPELLNLTERIHPLFDLEIARLTRERLTLLTRRDGLRRRHDWLNQALTGKLPAYPQDDANALPDETGALDALAFQRVHRVAVPAGGADLHGFTGSHVTLGFEAADELVVFVRLDALPAGIGIRPLISSALEATAPATRPFVWGTAPAEANGDRVGELPVVGIWTRLAVPMSRAGLAGHRIDGLAFAVFGGNAASEVRWGHAGKASAGVEVVWVNDALPTGAVPDGTWTWLDQGTPADASEDARFGLPRADNQTRRVTELETLLANWQKYRGGVLTVELGEPSGGRVTGTPPRTVEGGVDELIARLDGRIRAAGDHIDFGFLRARTDIYRLRQNLLGSENAGRFLTSAAAAEMVTRDANPVATEKQFADYFKRLAEIPAQTPSFSVASPAPAPLDRPQPMRNTRALVGGPSLISTPTFLAPAPSFETTKVAVAPLAPVAAPIDSNLLFTVPIVPIAPPPVVKPPPVAAPAPPPVVVVSEVKPAQFAFEAPPVINDVAGASLIGATYNTATVAERFQSPASVVASNSAVRGKDDFVRVGLSGLSNAGIVLNDLPVFGYALDGVAAVTGGDLLNGNLSVVDTDAQELPDGPDQETDVHEAVFFRRGIQAIDNTVRFLRGVETRAEEYRRLQADAKGVRERIAARAADIQRLLAELAVKLAEVRHDLSVARALRAEEQVQLDARLARRRAVLDEQVPYLVFRRPRLAPALNDVPLLPVQPAEVADPVPRCRSEAHDPPPELEAMVDLLRDLPVRWFKPLVPAFEQLRRVSQIESVLQLAQQRLSSGKLQLAALPSQESLTGTLLKQSVQRQTQRIQDRAIDADRVLRSLSGAGWQQAMLASQSIVAIRDLQVAPALPRSVTLAAAGLLDDVLGVASCLHAAFCQVPPATRLRWAQSFSQLDAAVSLRVLTVLPGFGDESLGVDSITWRQMQRMVDWLFAQVGSEAEPQAAINDLVRVCLLLASHAPVKRILSARIKRPVPAVVGTRLDIEIDPQLTRVGMQVLVQAPGSATLLAQAVVEDLTGGTATARIVTSHAAPGVMLGSEMRVQLQTGPALGLASVPKPAAGTPLATPAVQPAAEKRIARQVMQMSMMR
jgi:hypothetical protein